MSKTATFQEIETVFLKLTRSFKYFSLAEYSQNTWKVTNDLYEGTRFQPGRNALKIHILSSSASKWCQKWIFFFGWTIPLTESLWAWLVARLWDICCFMMAVLKPRQETYGTLGLLDENSIWLESINYSPEISHRVKRHHTLTYTLQVGLSLSLSLHWSFLLCCSFWTISSGDIQMYAVVKLRYFNFIN